MVQGYESPATEQERPFGESYYEQPPKNDDDRRPESRGMGKRGMGKRILLGVLIGALLGLCGALVLAETTWPSNSPSSQAAVEQPTSQTTLTVSDSDITNVEGEDLASALDPSNLSEGEEEDRMSLQIETETLPEEAGATATVRQDGKVHFEGSFRSQDEADRYVNRAKEVFGEILTTYPSSRHVAVCSSSTRASLCLSPHIPIR